MSVINYTALATGALGFTVALAWNEAVSRAIHGLVPSPDGDAPAHASLLYAIVITLLVIIVAVVINHSVDHFSKRSEQFGSPLVAGGRAMLLGGTPIVKIGSSAARK